MIANDVFHDHTEKKYGTPYPQPYLSNMFPSKEKA